MLPPYSPDFNPIENAFGLLKQKLQESYEGTHAIDLPRVIVEASRACLTPQIVENLYRGCGYQYVSKEARAQANSNWEDLIRHYEQV